MSRKMTSHYPGYWFYWWVSWLPAKLEQKLMARHYRKRITRPFTKEEREEIMGKQIPVRKLNRPR
jgi:hypothetical protein